MSGTRTPLVGACVSGTREVQELLPEWRTLAQTSGTPFADPDWLLTWAEVHGVAAEVRVLVVREAGRLVGLAPLYLRSLGGQRGSALTGCRVLQLLGTGPDAVLFELPEVLVDHPRPRAVLAALVAGLDPLLRDVDWAELPLLERQGWWEEAWTRGWEPRPAVLQKAQRPSVVLPLDPSWEAPLPPGKRNLRESVRRARNRLDASGAPWGVEVTEDGDPRWRAALEDLSRLHGRRAELGGPRHADDMNAGRTRELLEQLAGRSTTSRSQVWRLVVDGRPVAAQLVARDDTTLWVAFGGMDDVGWQVGGVTLLQHEAVRAAARDGLTRAVLSIGVDTYKLRWSEQVEAHQEFLLLGGRTGAGIRLSLFWQARAASQLRSALTRAPRERAANS